jgi:2-polyprenyl-3-methyl-5-hydroxy-6-metoxy-1,4-benzoquinol methylase
MMLERTTTPYLEEANLGVLRQIATGEKILDVGCGRGRLGQEMRSRGNVVHGIELDEQAAHAAAERLDFVYRGDATDRASLPAPIKDGGYDAIVFADVLEHVPNPLDLLRSMRPLLKREGRVVVSLPNVASWPVRFGLLLGQFEYRDSGVLDRTHLRFFTPRSARALLSEAGFSVEKEDATPYLARATLPVVRSLLPASEDAGAIVDSPAYRAYAQWVEPIEARAARAWPGLLAFQVVLVGRPRAPAATEGRRVAVALISRNEENAVVSVVESIRRSAPDARVVLVDSSTDRTAERAEACGATVIRQIPPRGYGPAMMTALRAASAQSDVVVTLDCDGTYPAELIPDIANLVLDDGWDIVNATRLARRPKAMPFENWIGNVVFAKTTNLVHGTKVTDVHSGMRAYRSTMLDALEFRAEGPALPVELLVKPARLGYRVIEVPIPYRDRIGVSTLRRFDSTLWTFRRILSQLGTGRRVGA